MQVSLKKSVTLVELIIAITLMGVIVLGAIAFHLSGARFLTSSETKTEVLNELTFVLQHLHKNISLATGDVNNLGITVVGAPPMLRIRQDLSAAGVPVNTPNNYGDDRVVGYQFDLATGRITFGRINIATGAFIIGPNSPVIISDGFVQLPGNPFSVAVGAGVNGGVAINNLALVFDWTAFVPASPNQQTNPTVTTIDTGGSRTVYFYSLSHSWN